MQSQVSVPASVRRRLGLGPGSTMIWEDSGEHVIVRRARRATRPPRSTRPLFPDKARRARASSRSRPAFRRTSASVMRAIDTNVLVRLHRARRCRTNQNEPRPLSRRAHGCLCSHSPKRSGCSTPSTSARPRRSRRASTCCSRHQQLVLERGDVVETALGQFRAAPKAGFSDCLMLEVARAAGHLPLGTFDKALARRDGAQLLG